LAGSLALAFPRFFTANSLGASVYVPVCVATGYLLGPSINDTAKNMATLIGRVEHFALAVLVFVAILIGIRRVLDFRNTK
jgi:membrane protein DedA with SNARE-associated domain